MTKITRMKHKYKPIILTNVISMTLDSQASSPWGPTIHEMSIETDKPLPFFDMAMKYGQKYAIDLDAPKQGVKRRIIFSEITPIYQTLEYGGFDYPQPHYHSKIRPGRVEIWPLYNEN